MDNKILGTLIVAGGLLFLLKPRLSNAANNSGGSIDIRIPGQGTYNADGTFTPEYEPLTDYTIYDETPDYGWNDYPIIDETEVVETEIPEYGWNDYPTEETLPIPDDAMEMPSSGWFEYMSANSNAFDALNNPNMQAFLAMIRWAENKSASSDENRYRTLYGSTLFDSMQDHPSNLGWPGVRLPDSYCRAAGFNPGCKTTAAGAYQFLSNTWNDVKKVLRLPDFGPASQDAGAVLLIKRAGAMQDVLAGRFANAVAKVRKVWASLPGAGYGQPEQSLEQLRQIYANAGGQFETV